jgi:hypothetical protein
MNDQMKRGSKNWKTALCILPLVLYSAHSFQTTANLRSRKYVTTGLQVSELDKVETTNRSEKSAPDISSGRLNGEVLDASTYEAKLLESWDLDPARQKGFDWEIEKLRRYFAGLVQTDDGNWVKRPSFFQFLINSAEFSSATVRRLDEPPKPVGILDVYILFATKLLENIGFGPALGMAAVPDAVIQKYEGSFFSFIKGALGGDLQTLAGGPLFLILAKYYKTYGPIFNLSFGPKSFLVISDPVMARHILRDSTAEQYCKGMLSEILEPIMGKGLIPADPKTWKVGVDAMYSYIYSLSTNKFLTNRKFIYRFVVELLYLVFTSDGLIE